MSRCPGHDYLVLHMAYSNRMNGISCRSALCWAEDSMFTDWKVNCVRSKCIIDMHTTTSLTPRHRLHGPIAWHVQRPNRTPRGHRVRQPFFLRANTHNNEGQSELMFGNRDRVIYLNPIVSYESRRTDEQLP